LLYNCCTSDLSSKLFHGCGDDSRNSFDVAPLSRSDVLVPEYRLNHNIRNTEFMKVSGRFGQLLRCQASVLENHGYWLAEAAIRVQVRELLPENIPSLTVPHPAWAGAEGKVKQAYRRAVDSQPRGRLGSVVGCRPASSRSGRLLQLQTIHPPESNKAGLATALADYSYKFGAARICDGRGTSAANAG
jgi:hypothetical protein